MWYFNCAKVISTKVKEAINMTNKKKSMMHLSFKTRFAFLYMPVQKSLSDSTAHI